MAKRTVTVLMYATDQLMVRHGNRDIMEIVKHLVFDEDEDFDVNNVDLVLAWSENGFVSPDSERLVVLCMSSEHPEAIESAKALGVTVTVVKFDKVHASVTTYRG